MKQTRHSLRFPSAHNSHSIRSAVLKSTCRIRIDSGMCREWKVTNQGRACGTADADAESSRERGLVINLLPQQSVGLYFLPLLRTIFFEFSPRTHLFSKMIQLTHWRHIHKALYCMLFVIFESFWELITLKHTDERGNILYRVHSRLEKEAKQPTYSRIPPYFPELSCRGKKRATIMHRIMHNHGSESMQSILDLDRSLRCKLKMNRCKVE